jgi:hypothetical protein
VEVKNLNFSRQDHTTLYFVFLAEQLPYYGLSSLELARRYSGARVCLIGPEGMGRAVRKAGIDFIALEDFYSPIEAQDVAARAGMSTSFRDGFWVKTLERFFVLEQFMRHANLTEVLHAELDQLLFRVDLLDRALRLLPETGIFVPFHRPDAAVASVFFCNNRMALSSLLDYARKSASISNEMALLADWAHDVPQFAWALPTLATVLRPAQAALPVVGPSPAQLGGIVDAAQLGQWVAGIEPRNVPLYRRHRTKFVDAPHEMLLTEHQLRSVNLSFNEGDGELRCVLGSGEGLRLYNLHIHSKIHSQLVQRRRSMGGMIALSNQPVRHRVPGTIQLRARYLLTDLLIPVARHPRHAASVIWRRSLSCLRNGRTK